jgi:hypothetical protein
MITEEGCDYSLYTCEWSPDGAWGLRETVLQEYLEAHFGKDLLAFISGSTLCAWATSREADGGKSSWDGKCLGKQPEKKFYIKKNASQCCLFHVTWAVLANRGPGSPGHMDVLVPKWMRDVGDSSALGMLTDAMYTAATGFVIIGGKYIHSTYVSDGVKRWLASVHPTDEYAVSLREGTTPNQFGGQPGNALPFSTVEQHIALATFGVPTCFHFVPPGTNITDISNTASHTTH